MMKNQNVALVSVIIPTFNGAQFLPQAIESVLSQTYPHFEIIVVDDGSTDGTKAIIEPNTNIRYIYQENQGVCVARNHGESKSNGDYLVF